MKLKTCKWCKTRFQPERDKQICCCPECAVEYGRKQSAKAEVIQALADRKTIKLRKEAIKTIRDWTKDAQAAFNAFIRERDKDKPCICCGLPLSSCEIGGKFDCGHYRSVGSAPHLRFDERNAHGQRKQCNRWGAGRAVDYRLGLINRLGIDSVESLEADQAPKKYSVEELKQIISTYKRKLKELKHGR